MSSLMSIIFNTSLYSFLYSLYPYAAYYLQYVFPHDIYKLLYIFLLVFFLRSLHLKKLCLLWTANTKLLTHIFGSSYNVFSYLNA